MKMRKIISLLLALVMVCSIIPMAVFAEGEATSVTFDFSSLTGVGKNEITSAAFIGCASDASYVSSVTLTKVYDGNASGGWKPDSAGFIKTGTSSVNGEIKMTFTKQVTKVELACHAWNTGKSDTIAVNNGTAKTAPNDGSFATLTFEIDASETVEIVTNKRTFIQSITVTFADSTAGGEEETPCEHTNVTDFVCDDCGEVVPPAADSVLTLPQAAALGKAVSAYTADKYYVSGTVTGFYGSGGTTYGNIYIEDADGNSFLIYGLYSADGSVRYDKMDVKPNIGDEVTVYGSIGNFNGSPQMKDGWLTAHTPVVNECEHTNVTDYVCDDCGVAVPPAAGATLTLPQATALGVAMKGAYTEGKYYITGEIVNIASTQYGNMTIKDEEGNTFYIYGTYSADGELRYDAMEVKPVAGDTVKVYGVIGSYNDAAQMKNGWIVEHIPAEGEGETTTDPEADSTLTIEEANALGASKDHNTYTKGKYYVTGVITEVYNDTYGNMYITDEDGNVLHVYGTYDADGTNRYDAMEVKPVAGDTVTVYGVIGQFNGKPQMKNAWIVEHVPADTGDDDNTGDNSPETGDFGFIALVSLMAVTGTALVVLKKKEF